MKTLDRQSNLSWVSVGLLMWCLPGCGGTGDGPPRYALAGEVTFDGKPVPNGMIRFIPDTAKGNRGPGAMTDIIRGKYKTSDKKGTVGGPMIIEIIGFDGVPAQVAGELSEVGSPLFQPYRVEIDLPVESAEKNFEVPKSSAKTKKSS